MQRSLRLLLPVDVADFTGLMSGKVKYYVGTDSSVHEAFRKLGHVPLENGTKSALKQYISLLVSQEQPLEILLCKDSRCFVGN